ncbi:MAG: hypothetical protein EOP55_09665 [Sphingobacteriales bacterium]|nr:MAG: hypothetical protein EOP55_09665 [Sphingobacteriales bacterium]
MRRFIIFLVLSIALIACKKNIPEPDVIKFKVFATQISQVNNNEPEILFWYVREAKSGGLYYVTSTKRLVDFSDYSFNHIMEIPPDLKDAAQLQDILVFIKHLRGNITTDY